jgi:GT2 family glycosyltransferase
VRRAVWEAVRFDDVTFDGFHLYDIDFSYRVKRAGFRLAVPLDLTIIHQSTGSYGQDWYRYAQRFEAKFAGALATRPDVIPGSIHCKVQTLDQAAVLLAGFAYFHYGAALPKRG